MSRPPATRPLGDRLLTELTWDQAVCHYVMVSTNASVTLCLESHNTSTATLRLRSGQEVGSITRIEVRLDLEGADRLDWVSAPTGPQTLTIRPASGNSLDLLMQGRSSSLRLSAHRCAVQAMTLDPAG